MITGKQRFVVIPADLLEGTEKMIILADYNFWADQEDELRHWCHDNNSSFLGMTVTVPNEQTLTAFCLRWA